MRPDPTPHPVTGLADLPEESRRWLSSADAATHKLPYADEAIVAACAAQGLVQADIIGHWNLTDKGLEWRLSFMDRR